MAMPTLPSNVPRPQQIPSNGPSSSSTPIPSNAPNGVRVKTEPGYEPQGYPNTALPSYYANPTAQQRAAQNLHQKFGAGASQQINQLQAQAAMGAQGAQSQRNPMNIQLPPQMTDQQRQEQAEMKRRQQEQQYQNRQAAQQHLQQAQQARERSSVENAQTDGAGDWDSLVAQRRSDASTHSMQTDLTIREQVEQMNRSMEGGGLMMPLSEQPKTNPSKKRKIVAGPSSSDSAPSADLNLNSMPSPKILQLDGADNADDDDKRGIKDELFDDDDEDEDAINSDLDDPDDNVIEEEQEEGRPNQIMLCTYDKVARVKNKWKCTLKDGVLTTGGKESVAVLNLGVGSLSLTAFRYIFHRAQGEFEW